MIIRPLEGPPHLLVPTFSIISTFIKTRPALNLVQDSTENIMAVVSYRMAW
ncbi:hypothetical protein [Salinicoccus halodurans]|uniref:hypothetical protein n=1 Tax=Salinicoccus halodurans TaxID=407035 RepID=UPI001EF117AA|nr:hypothetical protein [Salinicoccus halodurans]